MGHTALAPKGREGRNQAGLKGPKPAPTADFTIFKNDMCVGDKNIQFGQRRDNQNNDIRGHDSFGITVSGARGESTDASVASGNQANQVYCCLIVLYY